MCGPKALTFWVITFAAPGIGPARSRSGSSKRRHSPQDPVPIGSESFEHDRRGEPHPAWLVCVLPAEPPLGVRTPGHLHPPAAANDSPETEQTSRQSTQWDGQSSLAQRLLCRAGTVFLEARPCLGLSILMEVKLPTAEPDVREPHVRFGGRRNRTQSAVPTPLRNGSHRGRSPQNRRTHCKV